MGLPSNRGTRCISLLLIDLVYSWTPSSTTRPGPKTFSRIIRQRSTPFEANFYDNPFEKDGNDRTSSAAAAALSVSPDTKLVVGLNKYSHDATICAANAETGEVLFALSKERLSRRKHDAGNVASLVEACLEALDLQLDNVQKVVMNNHHHRIIPLEQNARHMQWESGLHINGGTEVGYDEPENLLPTAEKHELSHHLAHAYSTAAQAPFDSGLCVVMDGMGESYRTMQQAVLSGDHNYTSDLSFGGVDSFDCIPSDVAERASRSPFDWREAESVYVFAKREDGCLDLRPIFKRFTPENSPPTLYNHGFENMDSVGALYSRASSHIFGDWNACGKVMGLAPWAHYEWTDPLEDGGSTAKKKLRPELHNTPIMSGRLYSEEEDERFRTDRSLMEGAPYIARNDPDLFDTEGGAKKRYDFDDNDDTAPNHEPGGKRMPRKVALEAIALAHRIQIDLEDVVMDFVRHFKDKTKETNLCLAGGVALNSVLNGRLARELGFERTFISPYPGDDGIAVGCCAFGLFKNKCLLDEASTGGRPPVWNRPFLPYLGPEPSEESIRRAIEHAAPWLEVELVGNDEQRISQMAQELSTGAVIAWYRSRSEIGPRALGHRSILADPRKKGLVRFINEHVKSRESFRPFAPSVLAKEASKWFDLGDSLPEDCNISPYMSMTVMVREDKRAQIPAVTHVDGSSRLQTVTKEDEPLYHKFISKFFQLTGVPLVLNTSFNTLPGEPIVESPTDAIRAFLNSMGSIETLVIGDYVVKRKTPDLRKLLGEASKDGTVKTIPLCPKRAGRATFQSSFEVEGGETDEDTVLTTTKVRMPDRPMHGNRNEWFPLLDELEGDVLSVCDGTVTLNDIVAYYSAVPKDESYTKEDMEATQNLLQNIVHRLVRLFEHTLISW